jgi:hypothetical protein
MRITSATLIALLFFQVEIAHAQQSQYPSLEDFNNTLTACAAGASISLNGEMKGNFESIYKDKVVDAPKGVTIITSADFLKLLPEKDRLEGFRLYQACFVGIINGTVTKASPKPQTNNIDLPSTIQTFGKRYDLKANLLTADTEIRAFSAESRASNGPPGRNGNNGSNGAAGAGGKGGDGAPGTAGGDGQEGQSAGDIRIEAESFTGSLHVVNSGQAGGIGGPGGSGGRGGAGGRGTDSQNGVFDCRAGPGNGGQGGNAGPGGDAGRGGNGGPGGAVILKFNSISPGSTISVISAGGRGGTAGPAGLAGTIGQGGPVGNTGGHCGSGGRGPGAPGVEASAGRRLGDGQNGPDGVIEITVGDQTITTTGQFTKKF